MDHNETDDTDDGRGVGRRSVLGALGLGAGASLLGGAGWLLDQEAEGTRRLTALLSGENQVPPVATTGTGTATFTLNQDGTLDWRVVVVDLAGITQAHIHEGGADENGPVVAPLFQFTPNPDGTGEGFPRDATAEDPIVRSGTVEDQQLVEDVLANPDQYYVNVHTVQNPAGTIRGQMMAEAEATTFTVRIENVSTEQTLMTPEGSQAVPLSPGAYAVYPTPDLPEPAATETPPVGTEEPGTETEAPAETETEPDTPTEAETPTAAETETPVETEAEIEQMSVQAGTETETPGVVTGRPDDETETPGMETPTPAPETPTPEEETETPEEETETPAPGTPTGTPTPVPTPTVTPAMPEVANPIFTPGQPVVPNGLEQIAEDGDPGALAESLAAAPNVAQSGTFNRPVGIEEPGPIGPGDAYEFVVTGTPEQRLTFATMFIPSNDLFFAPGADGISLFEGGEPISGDVTEQIALWDAGTEVNEQPGVGPNQAPRQEFPGDGEEEGNRVRLAEEVPDGFDYPATSEVIEVTITPGVAPAMETPAGVSPTPTEEAEEETPTEEAEEETPTEEAEEETPTEEAEEETPTEAPAEETPTEAPAEGTPTDTPTSGGGDGGGY